MICVHDSLCSEEQAKKSSRSITQMQMCWGRRHRRCEMMIWSWWMFPYSLLAVDTDDRLPLGLVHNNSPFISPFKKSHQLQNEKENKTQDKVLEFDTLKPLTFAIFSFSLRFILFSIRPTRCKKSVRQRNSSLTTFPFQRVIYSSTPKCLELRALGILKLH